MVARGMAARSIVRLFADEVESYFEARERLGRENLNPEARGRAAANLTGALRERASSRLAELTRHEERAHGAAVAASPAAQRRTAIHQDPTRVHALRELLRAATDAEVAESARLALEEGDYFVSAALVGLNRDLNEEAARDVEAAISMTTPEYERGVQELAVIRHEKARLVGILEFAAPASPPRALEAANEALAFEVGGRGYRLNQGSLERAYEACGVDMAFTIPASPEPSPAAHTAA